MVPYNIIFAIYAKKLVILYSCWVWSRRKELALPVFAQWPHIGFLFWPLEITLL